AVLFSCLLIQNNTANAEQKTNGTQDEVRALLLEDVTSIIPSGSPGPVCVFGDTAFPVVVGRSGRNQGVLIAAAVVENSTDKQGRIIAFGHTGYIDPATFKDDKSTSRFFENALRWVSQYSAKPGTAKPEIGVYRNNELVNYLESEGKICSVKELANFDNLDGIKCVCVSAHAIGPKEIEQLQNYVKTGGGLIITGLGWGWQQVNPGKTLQNDFAGNKLLGPFGIVWADGFLDTGRRGVYDATTQISPYSHAKTAYDAVKKEIDAASKTGNSADADKEKQTLSVAELAQISYTLQMAMSELPESGTTSAAYGFPKLVPVANEQIIISANEPVTESDILKRLVITDQAAKYRQAVSQLEKADSLEAEKTIITDSLTANPSGSVFPGPVSSDAKRVTRTVKIDTSVPDWHSTGLYAAPGEVITVKIPESAVAATSANANDAPNRGRRRGGVEGLSLRIGNHTDTIWHLNKWERFPEISFMRTLNRENTAFANPFGGLVYVVVPRNSRLGEIEVEISGAVEAPFFELGKTTKEQWQTIRKNPAPWAELATKKIVISVPSEVVREINDPSVVLEKYWDPTLDAIADFAAWDKNRLRPERITPDQQISAGYMHSGYPIMTFLDVKKNFVDEDFTKRDNWGFFHEIGHNHQSGDWTFDGTGEVTVNFFSLYCYEKVLGVPIDQSRSEMYPDNRKKAFDRYIQNGKKYEDWKNDPFLALSMFVELQQEFGWEPFIAMIAEFRDLPQNERPKTDLEKRQQFVKRFSKAAGKDITPVFQKWGIPLE
ncbi:MAG: M60 family metallopeptidase, partial [Thermoguttaceae bacterium]